MYTQISISLYTNLQETIILRDKIRRRYLQWMGLLIILQMGNNPTIKYW